MKQSLRRITRSESAYLMGCVLKLTLKLPSCFAVIVSPITFLTYHSGLPSSSDLATMPGDPSALIIVCLAFCLLFCSPCHSVNLSWCTRVHFFAAGYAIICRLACSGRLCQPRLCIRSINCASMILSSDGRGRTKPSGLKDVVELKPAGCCGCHPTW